MTENNTKIRELIEHTLKGDERLWAKNDATNKQELNQTKLLDLVKEFDKKANSKYNIASTDLKTNKRVL